MHHAGKLDTGSPGMWTTVPSPSRSTGALKLPKMCSQVALPARDLDRGPFGRLQHHLGHRHVDVLTDTGATALDESGEDADGRLQARVQVGM